MALIGPMSGSLTRLESGSPAWVSGNGLSITSGSDGSVTFTAVQQINLANFGDKSDGNATLTAIDAGVLWATSSSVGYTMNRDAFLNNLTINAGVSLRPDGFLPYIAGTLVNSGTIECRGADASGVTGGAIVTNSGTFWANASAGGAGNSTTAASTPGNGSIAVSNSAGGRGGAGGTGNSVGAGVGGAITAPIASVTSWRTLNYVLSQRLISATTTVVLNGGSGGASGGASGAGVGNTATSGGGGGGAINLFLIMNTLDNAGTIRSRGGNGANASISGGVGAGGGGGGGAGSVLIAVNKVLALGTISSTGGTAGTGAGTSTAASAGGVGPVIILSGSL